MTIAIVYMDISYILVSSHPYPWKRDHNWPIQFIIK